MKHTLLPLALLLASVANAQSFIYSNTVPVPITDSITESVIVADPPCGGLTTVSSVAQVTVNITYPMTGLLTVLLNDMVLIEGIGISDVSYINTTLVSLGTPDVPHIASGTEPYTGTFASALNFALLAGLPMEGPWILKALVSTNDTLSGSIDGWSIALLCESEVGVETTLNNNNDVRIFPMPASDELHIKTNNDAVLTVFDYTGREVLMQSVPAGGMISDISLLPQGIYTAVFQSDDFRIAKQVLISR